MIHPVHRRVARRSGASRPARQPVRPYAGRPRARWLPGRLAVVLAWVLAGFAPAALIDAPALAAQPDSLIAQMPVYEVPPVRVEAPRVARGRALPGARTVLDRAWLLRVDPVDLSRALLPGAGLRVAGLGDGAGATLSLRGLNAERVAVLVDGRPVNSAQGGGVDLQPIDIEGLERIEVLRGAGGAMFGPHALAGSINLVRRTDRVSRFALRGMGGTDSRALLRANAALARGRFSGEGALGLETASPELGRAEGFARGGGGRLRLAWHPEQAAAVDVEVEHRRDLRDVPGSRAFPSPQAEREDRVREGRAGVRGWMAGAGAVDLDVSWREQRRDYADPGAPLGPIDDSHRNRQGRAVGAWRLAGPGGSLRSGAEFVHDELRSTTDGAVSRKRLGLFSQATHVRGDWGFSPALRLDALEGFSPRGSARFTVTRALLGRAEEASWMTARAGAGTAFRPPTFDDLFWPARASAAGNPDLRPERAWDLDLGIEGRAASARGEASAFLTRVHDLIQWSPGPDGVWRPRNIGEARMLGLELAGELALDAIGLPARLSLSYTGLDARDATRDAVTGNRRLVGRAAHQVFAEVSWQAGPVTLDLGARGLGRVPLTAANTKWQEGYALWHSRLRCRLGSALRLDLEARNLLDTDYEDLRGYASPGREVLVGFRYAGTP